MSTGSSATAQSWMCHGKDQFAAERIEVGGLVLHRERPATAGRVSFLSLEDETGVV
jgi:hypothetical protein